MFDNVFFSANVPIPRFVNDDNLILGSFLIILRFGKFLLLLINHFIRIIGSDV
jgi:hypothetical protein